VCQRWRQIILTSPLGLNLRLHCTHGKPVLKALNCWPTLPIVILYGGGGSSLDPPASEDDDNIIAALKQSTRVSSISLTTTSSIIEKLPTHFEPFSELEELALLSQDTMELSLPSSFRWGPRLRTLQTTRVAFPSFPQLLLPSRDLVDLQLCEIPSVGYFSPEAFANALSGMTDLRNLSLHFLSFPPRRKFLRLPPPSVERTVLPALTRLKYRGTSKYLDSFVARIDAPHLEGIDIVFFYQPTIDASQLGRFIERIEVQTPLCQADIETSAHAISISFTNSSTATPLRLQISCKQLDWQLSCMAQVCDQCSPFLFRVEELRINTSRSSIGQDDVAGEQWVDFVRSFGGARDIWMANELTTDILRALGRADERHMTVLPALCHLRVENPKAIMIEPSSIWDDSMLFFKMRSLSGRPVQINVPLPQCHICQDGFGYWQKVELECHLTQKHMNASFRIMCSYCSHIVSMPGNDHMFWRHLAVKHIRVVRKDALLSNPLLAHPSAVELEDLRRRHSTFLVPDVVTSSTKATEPHSQ
jgi:hypothetical protein